MIVDTKEVEKKKKEEITETKRPFFKQFMSILSGKFCYE